MQPDMCAAVRDSCTTGPDVIPVCTDTVPMCPNITIDEYVTCRIDVLKSFVEYNRTITCESAQPLPPDPDPASCAGAYERCPAMRMLKL